MNEFLRESMWTVILFFAILLSIAYFNGGWPMVRGTLADPLNWIVLALVIAAGYGFRRYRIKKREEGNE